MRLEVHVQPLAARSLCSANGMFGERCAESPTLVVASNDGVEDERVTGAVPRHIDEPNQGASRTGGHPAETVLCKLFAPVEVPGDMSETLGMQASISTLGLSHKRCNWFFSYE